MSSRPDVIIIGGGHNGLVAALRLARSGCRVTVLERRRELGGLAAADEFHPGYTVPGLLHDTAQLRPWVVEKLGLEQHGLVWQDEPMSIFAPAAGKAGEPGLLLHHDPQQAYSELAQVSTQDALAYGRWRAFLKRVEAPVRGALDRPPPRLRLGSPGELWQLGRDGLALRRLGKKDMTELMRVTPMCAADWLRELFATEPLCELLALPAVLSTFLGPYSAGSAANLLVTECTSGRSILGGPGALIRALVAAAEKAGVELRTGVPVEAIRVRDGRVLGVALESGEEIHAPVVAASCDPKQTLLRLVPAPALPLRLAEDIGAFRTRGTCAKVHLALSGRLEMRGREGERLEAIRIGGGHLDHLERAFDAIKYGRLSAAPHLDIRVPTVSATELAPEGDEVVSILVSFAPYELAAGWSVEMSRRLGDLVTACLADHAPQVRDQIVATEVLTPIDLETRYGLSGGQLHHGEHALDQLFSMRPSHTVARYRTPVRGLFLASSGCHPGGGVTGVPGFLAAEAIRKAA